MNAPFSAAQNPYAARMLLSHRSERSILDAELAPGLGPRFVDGRRRIATASGAAWFHGNHLAVVNLYGGTLRIYRFDEGAGAELVLLHEIETPYPGGVAASPDGRLLAVSHAAIGGGGLSLYRLDPHTHTPSAPGETIRRAGPGTQFHGVNFSADSRHLAATEMGFPGYVEMIAMAASAPGRLETACVIENHRPGMTAKAAAFSDDGRFAALGWAPRSQADASGGGAGGALSVHRYDPLTGVVAAEPVAEMTGTDVALRNIETCAFLPRARGGTYRILAANQGDDRVSAFAFDPRRSLVSAGAFAEGLSFPHGLGVSADGRFAAITTYGDDCVHILGVAPAVGEGFGWGMISRALAALTG